MGRLVAKSNCSHFVPLLLLQFLLLLSLFACHFVQIAEAEIDNRHTIVMQIVLHILHEPARSRSNITRNVPASGAQIRAVLLPTMMARQIYVTHSILHRIHRFAIKHS